MLTAPNGPFYHGLVMVVYGGVLLNGAPFFKAAPASSLVKVVTSPRLLVTTMLSQPLSAIFFVLRLGEAAPKSSCTKSIFQIPFAFVALTQMSPRSMPTKKATSFSCSYAWSKQESALD